MVVNKENKYLSNEFKRIIFYQDRSNKNKMKTRISLIAVMVLGTIFSEAQQKTSRTGGTTFGLRAGVNFQNINGKDENDDKLKKKKGKKKVDLFDKVIHVPYRYICFEFDR